MNFAFVNIVAGTIIVAQLIARFASAPIGAPEIDTTLSAQALYVSTLVDINTDFVGLIDFLEARVALAAVRANRIQALGINGADLSLVELTFVDVFTATIFKNVTSWTRTSVTTGLIETSLVRSTTGLAICTFVNVCAEILELQRYLRKVQKICFSDYQISAHQYT